MKLFKASPLRLSPPCEKFDIFPDRVAGNVSDFEGYPRQTLSLRLVETAPPNFGQVIAVVKQQQLVNRRERGETVPFSFNFPSSGRGRDFLTGALAVQARIEASEWGNLKLDGAAELYRIKEHFREGCREIARIDFRCGGNLASHQKGGWHTGEAHFAWMDGVESTLVFRTVGNQSLECRLEAAAYLAEPSCRQQRLEIWIDNEQLFYYKAEERSSLYHRFRIPSDLLTRNKDLTLKFVHQDAIRPFDAEGLPDKRLLSFALKRLSLEEIEQ